MNDLNDVYDQISDESTNSDPPSMNFHHSIPPYTPDSSSDQSTEHFHQHMSMSPSIVQQKRSPIKSYLVPQLNSKRELHKELIYRQKMYVDR